MIDQKRAVGCIYLKQTDGGIDKYRCVAMQNSSMIRLQKDGSNTTFKVNEDVLKKEYILLEPDGYIFNTIVTMSQDSDSPLTQDVIISFFRAADIIAQPPVPYCICRQNINSPFDVIKAEQTEQGKITVVGCCVSQETVPAGIDFLNMLSCNKVLYGSIIAIYMEDGINQITSYPIVEKYNEALERIKISFEEYCKKTGKDTMYFTGYCKSLRGLLLTNEFMYDEQRGLGITCLSFEVVKNLLDESTLASSSKELIENVFKFSMSSHTIVDYDRDIDLTLVRGDKAILRDISGKLYLLTYVKVDEEYTPSGNYLS